MTADNAFSYGCNSSTNVGSFTLRIQVEETDTEQTILDKINNSLNSNTILDMYTESSTRDYGSVGSMSAKTHQIDSPIWGGACL